MQEIICDSEYKKLKDYFLKKQYKNVFFVRGKSSEDFEIYKFIKTFFEHINIKYKSFMRYESNPQYESILDGVDSFNSESFDLIIALGGGSAIDVAKCIKIFANADINKNIFSQNGKESIVELMAIPTTAGTGSEVTDFAVVYYNGEKKSVENIKCKPDTVILDYKVLSSLPMYQRKATMLDALSHAIEAAWSINSTEESIMYSEQAIKLIVENKEAYLNNSDIGNKNMLRAANTAGKAINIAKTTAAHAMSYKLTNMYGVPHGYAVAMCLRELIPYMSERLNKCIDMRGEEYLKKIFIVLNLDMQCKLTNLSNSYDEFISDIEFPNIKIKKEDIEILVDSVNIERLKNNPIPLKKDEIKYLYNKILGD